MASGKARHNSQESYLSDEVISPNLPRAEGVSAARMWARAASRTSQLGNCRSGDENMDSMLDSSPCGTERRLEGDAENLRNKPQLRQLMARSGGMRSPKDVRVATLSERIEWLCSG